jgi:hypothetical protein
MPNKQKEIIRGNTLASNQEIQAYDHVVELMKRSPIPDNEILANLSLWGVRPALGRTLFMHEIYKQTLNTHGVFMEFGVRWGQNLALMTSLRNLYEPYNVTRKVIGFDTFEGFPHVHKDDGTANTVAEGNLGVTPIYEDELEQILLAQEQLGPRPNVKKHELVKGDVLETVPKYLEEHPETIISLAYFDFDLYEPTKKCLEFIRPYLAKNSIVAFDELLSPEFPGETKALRDAWGGENFEIIRNPISPQQSYIIMK